MREQCLIAGRLPGASSGDNAAALVHDPLRKDRVENLPRQSDQTTKGLMMTRKSTNPPSTLDSVRSLPSVQILSAVAVPLLGESPKGGWSAEIRPEDSIHALIAIHTDTGITGYGSVFTDGRLVQAGLKVLE